MRELQRNREFERNDTEQPNSESGKGISGGNRKGRWKLDEELIVKERGGENRVVETIREKRRGEERKVLKIYGGQESKGAIMKLEREWNGMEGEDSLSF